MSAAPILTILKDGETVRSVPIEGEALLGRDEACVIRLEDRMISRQHALFKRKGNEIQVEKKSEFAPLLVNGSDCTQAVLKDGDVIAIGPYLVKLSLEKQQSAPQSGPAPTSAAPAFSADAHNNEMNAALNQEPALEAAAPVASLVEPDAGLAQPLTLEVPGEAPGLDAPSDQAVLPDLQPMSDVSLDPPLGDASAEGAISLEPLTDSPEGAAPESSQVDSPDNKGFSLDAPASSAGLEDPTRVVATNGPKFKLIFKAGDANVLEHELQKDEIFIGRGKDCDVVLTDKKVSRKNTQLFRSGNVISLKDLGSVNGTYVNGKKVTEAVLAGGDRIKIGEAEFEFRADQPGYSEQEKDFLAVPPMPESSGPAELPPFQMEGGGMPMLGVAADGVAAAAPLMIPDEALALPQQDAAADQSAGIAGIAGIAGDSAGKKKSLMEKFRALPKQRQWIIIGLVIAFGYFFFLEDDDQVQAPGQKQGQVKKGAKGKKKGANGDTAEKEERMARPFSALSKEKQQFVRTQHKLAFEYFQHQDFANALAAIKPIFEYVDDFEDSREIMRYAEDGIRQMKIIAEEKAKKEAEEAKARKITELLNKARELMDKKKYTEASSVFNDIIVIDPENAQVAQWQAKIRQYEEDQKIEAQKKQVQAEINGQAWAVYKEGVALHRSGQLRKALAVFAKVKDIGAVDARPARLASEQIKSIHDEIQTQLEPILKDGKEKEDAQDFVNAMASYNKALSIEPASGEATQGFNRVKSILHERAKALYTEAVLAESYSDFATAKKKFQQCSETAPKDSVYRERAIRKLARYFKAEDMAPTGP
jgi:pSer/pThr/pTyr-binding forkhead associated (FHA) protein/tetratricopeptide (TPR) repeat protein